VHSKTGRRPACAAGPTASTSGHCAAACAADRLPCFLRARSALSALGVRHALHTGAAWPVTHSLFGSLKPRRYCAQQRVSAPQPHDSHQAINSTQRGGQADPRVGRESPVFEHDAQVVCANAKNIVIVPLQHRSALSGLVSAHALAPAAGAHSNGEWRLRTTSGM